MNPRQNNSYWNYPPPRNVTSSSGILDFIKEHKALISGGAVAVLVVSGVALGIVMTCCSKTTPHAEVTVLVRNVPKTVASELIPRDFLAEGEIAVSDIWEIADRYFDENFIAEYGDKRYETALTKSNYKNRVHDLLLKNLKVKVVNWDQYKYEMRYSTIFDAEKACKEVFEKIIRK